jgi:hypothetical protein
MQVQSRSEPVAAFSAANPPAPTLYTVEQFAERQPAFTEPALRNLIFKAAPRQCSKGEIPGNGLIECGAVLRLGRKVLIDEGPFLEWVRASATKEGPQ